MGIFNFKKKSKKEVSYKDKTFILCHENDINKLMEVLCRKFNIDNSGNGNTLEIHNNDICISVAVFSQSMGENEEKFIKDQANRVYGHFYDVDTQHIDIKTNLLYSIHMTKSMIFVNYSFVYDDEFDKKTFVEEIFASLLNEIQGIMLIMDEKEDGIYCEGKSSNRAMELILSVKGESSLLNYVPDETFHMTSENGEINEEQIERRKRILNQIRNF